MRLFALLAATILLISSPAMAEDEVRLDHKGFMDAPVSEDGLLGDEDTAAGSNDLSIRIEHDSYAGGDDADSQNSSTLSRDGGFNFSAN